MKSNTTVRQLVVTLGLLVAAVGCSTKSVEPKVEEPNAGDIIENSIKMKLAYVPPGEFDMGSPDSEEGRETREQLHHVKLTKGFYLG